jgi:hypothetical protein
MAAPDAGAHNRPAIGDRHGRRLVVTQQETYAGRTRSTYADEARGGGWITFAGVMIVMSAILNIVDGIAAISNSSFFIGDAKYILSDLKTWGWIILLIGVVELFVAFGIWAGSNAARWAGIAIVSINAIAQLLFIPAYPFWALAIFTVDVLVLYGLAAYGGRPTLS